jgi:hypothetical protein
LTHAEASRLKQLIIIIGDQPGSASQIIADAGRAKPGNPLIFGSRCLLCHN